MTPLPAAMPSTKPSLAFNSARISARAEGESRMISVGRSVIVVAFHRPPQGQRGTLPMPARLVKSCRPRDIPWIYSTGRLAALPLGRWTAGVARLCRGGGERCCGLRAFRQCEKTIEQPGAGSCCYTSVYAAAMGITGVPRPVGRWIAVGGARCQPSKSACVVGQWVVQAGVESGQGAIGVAWLGRGSASLSQKVSVRAGRECLTRRRRTG